MKKLLIAATIAAAATVTAEAQRSAIRIVGSSTVFPFATAVIEEFGATTDYEAPVMSSDGSGGGFKLFCAGVGLDHPDISNASSRQMSKKDICDANGVEFAEFMVGYDGIVMANAKAGVTLSVSVDQLAPGRRRHRTERGLRVDERQHSNEVVGHRRLIARR